MPKNIVICCDGTGNDFDNPETDSNVIKLYNTLHIGVEQIAYYHPGVGTMGAPTAQNRLEKWWSKVKGMAFGSGLLENVSDAYRYLMNTYEAGDHIYLFGFSRGAYTARSVGSLLHVFGLLEPGNEQLIPYILRLFSSKTKNNDSQQTILPAEEAFKYAFSREVEVYFCGVWDTVSSYGWINSPIELPFAGQNPVIRAGRHAISIQEHRCCYQDNLWGDALPGQDIRQVWFNGVHSDVGGSYPETEAQLSKITFEWLLVEAIKTGLVVEDARVQVVLGGAMPPPFLPSYVKPDPKGIVHPSLSKYWWLLEYFPRRKGKTWCLPRGRWARDIPENSLIHATVPLGKDPPTLPKAYALEPWVRYQPLVPATVQHEAELTFAVVESVAPTPPVPAPLVSSLARR